MKIKTAWAIQSFIICLVLNAVLAGLMYLMADKIMAGLAEWLSPFLAPGGANLPEDTRSAIKNAATFLGELHQYLAPAIAALSGAVTLLLWFFIFLTGRRHIRRAAAQVSTPPPAAQPVIEPENPDGPPKA